MISQPEPSSLQQTNTRLMGTFCNDLLTSKTRCERHLSCRRRSRKKSCLPSTTAPSADTSALLERTMSFSDGTSGRVCTPTWKTTSSCEDCSRHKRPKTATKAPPHPLPVVSPFHRAVIDVCGPFPKTRNGNLYIVCCTDSFSK